MNHSASSRPTSMRRALFWEVRMIAFEAMYVAVGLFLALARNQRPLGFTILCIGLGASFIVRQHHYSKNES